MDTLLLNANAQPVNLLPLSTLTWQEAVRYLVLDKVTVLSWYDEWIVRSASWQTRVPAVMILKEYQKPKTVARLSKQNVFLRDLYICQYCGNTCSRQTATVDHVLPKSFGGKSSWTNLTTACKLCNTTKSNNKKIKPAILPHKPDFWELAEKRKRMGFKIAHPSWSDYI